MNIAATYKIQIGIWKDCGSPILDCSAKFSFNVCRYLTGSRSLKGKHIYWSEWSKAKVSNWNLLEANFDRAISSSAVDEMK